MFHVKLLSISLVCFVTACSSVNSATGQKDPILIYGKGKCTITGLGAGGAGVASLQNGFSITGDCAEGAYLYVGPPPAGFNPPALHPVQ